MKIIVISDPEDISQEAEAINGLFEEGLETFHFRKPSHDKSQIESSLKQIKPQYLRRVVIHSHYGLIDKYNLKGIHFPEKVLTDLNDANISIKKLQTKGMTVSASFHSTESICTNSLPLDYVFLSPIYDSISKPGYKSKIDLDLLPALINAVKKRPQIIALGGVEEDKVLEVTKSGFDGFALLGCLWNEYKISNDLNKLIARYRRIKNLTKADAGQA